MDEQLPFDFPERRAQDAAHPTVILRHITVGDDGIGSRIEAHWPDFQMTSWFRNWREALPIVLHELNSHVQVRVRP